MKKFQRMTAALLATATGAGLVLSACGGTDSTGSGGVESGGAGGGTEAPAVGAASENAWDGSLPLTEEKETLTIWMKNDVALMNAAGGDPNNSPFFQELEKRTNVHIEWQIPASGSETEQFNLLFTSGELPDIMYYQPPGYIDGLDAAVEDGYLLDLTPYLADNMPNYLAALEGSGEKVQKMAKTDAGRYACVVAVYQTEQPPWMGLMLRKDWLDDLGLDMPVTVEDWEEMLTAFKEEKGASAPLSVSPDYLLNLGAGLGLYGGGFGSGWYQTDGKAGYYFYSDPEAGREVLTMLNRWYTSELIDPDFATADMFGDSVLVNNGSTGVINSIYTFPSTMFAAATQEGAEFAAVQPPVAKEGDPIHYRMENQVYGVQAVVSTDCEKPELALRWLDYLYSEEGAMLANYGIEGETYTMVDGKPQYTELMTSNPEGMTYDDALRYYTMAPGFVSFYTDWTRELGGVPDEAVAMMDDWAVAGMDYLYPGAATMSAEENQEYSNLFTDLQTYVKESVLAFITGEKSMDEYDGFIDTMKQYNIERCIELKQAALERYNAR